MEALQSLGTAMGLSMMAGINLYLTVFVTGLAINLGWVQLAPHLHNLQGLGDPLVLTVAGVMFFVEFIIDKWPYADSGWDTIHTFVRPIGGAILGLKVLGGLDPRLEIVGVLLGGSVAFTAHAAKAGTRLLVNTSPEPVTNIATSVGEDVFVLAGIWFVNAHPVLSLILVIIFVVTFWYFAPKFFRQIRASAVGILHRLGARRHGISAGTALPDRLAERAENKWLTLQEPGEQIAWAIPCFSGRMKPLGRNVRGYLIGTTASRVLFIGRKNFRMVSYAIALVGGHFTDDPGAVFHRLSVIPSAGNPMQVRVTRKFSPFLPQIMQWIRERSQPSPPASGPAETAAVR